ncbi:MAG TPA: hypothetical protein VHY37_07910 [Tepidisphaeraceae bacterium]|nr:hypothetical protein [Tepidisphaeraceae bacterium]
MEKTTAPHATTKPISVAKSMYSLETRQKRTRHARGNAVIP